VLAIINHGVMDGAEKYNIINNFKGEKNEFIM
jgi:hypothetical protein